MGPVFSVGRVVSVIRDADVEAAAAGQVVEVDDISSVGGGVGVGVKTGVARLLE